MDLAFQCQDMPHLIPVMQASESSLTYLVNDLAARRNDRPGNTTSGADLEAWMNALHRQERPLVASTQGRANLEAWLALVEV